MTRILSLLITFSVASVAQQYTISTIPIAGGGTQQPVTPAPGVNLVIAGTAQLAVDAANNLYFNGQVGVFKLDQNGIVTQIAGIPYPGFSGDGGPATQAVLNVPGSLAIDRAGNLFVADTGNYRVRRIAPSGIIATIAGTGASGVSGDGGPAVAASLDAGPMAVDRSGNLYIGDIGSVRKISPSGIITTVVGTGTPGFSGDGGLATSAQVYYPAGLAADEAGNLYISDYGFGRVRKVSSAGIITTIAGGAPCLSSMGDGGPAIKACLLGPQGLALDSAGNLYIADSDTDSAIAAIRKVSANGTITTVAGRYGDSLNVPLGDGGPATSAFLYGASDVAFDSAGNLFIADYFNQRIRKVTPDGIIDTVVGKYPPPASSNGPAAGPLVTFPKGVAVDSSGNLFILDSVLQKVTPEGTINTVATVSGNALTQDAAGNLVVAGFAVAQVSPDGNVSTLAKLFSFGTPGVGGYGVAVDPSGNVFVGSGSIVSKISPTGVVTTAAGGGKDVPGDGGLATSAALNNVTGLLFDGSGNLFLSEIYGHRVRKVSPSGIITTVAGTGVGGYSGDGGPALSAQLNGPDGLALDDAGNLYIADTYNSLIRMVTPDGKINTIAGSANPLTKGYSGDGFCALSAQLNNPWSLTVDHSGNVYVADTWNNVIRLLSPAHAAVLISYIVDSASQMPTAVSPGKIVTIYGGGLGPAQSGQNQPSNGLIGTSAGGTTVSFDGVPAPILYASSTRIEAIVPYAITAAKSQVTVSYQGQTSPTFLVSVLPSAPSIFSANQTAAGQIAAINTVDGTLNSAANPVKVGGYVTFYATGEGQTSPAGVDGKLAGSAPPQPLLPVTVTVGGVPATVQYKGGAPGQVAGVMQINVQIPTGVHPGGYVPVVLQVGDTATPPDAVWIAVSGN